MLSLVTGRGVRGEAGGVELKIWKGNLGLLPCGLGRFTFLMSRCTPAVLQGMSPEDAAGTWIRMALAQGLLGVQPIFVVGSAEGEDASWERGVSQRFAKDEHNFFV